MSFSRYMFTAHFEPWEDNKGYTVTFPDLPGCITEGSDFEEAAKNAKEALELHLYGMEEDGEEIPVPTPVPEVNMVGPLVVITAWMDEVRDEMRNKSIKKTLTIPKWLNDEAEKAGINFSQVLQTSLKRLLDIPDTPERRT